MTALGLGHVDHDDLRVIAKGAAKAETKVHRNPDHECDVGSLKRVRARPRKEQLVVGGNATAGEAVQEDRNAQRLRKLKQLGLAVPPIEIRPGHHDRTLSRAQQLGRPFDRPTVRPPARTWWWTVERVLGLGGLHEHVIHRKIDKRRSAMRGQRARKRLVEQPRNLGGALGGDRELGERTHERDVIDLLQRPHPPAPGRSPTAEDEHRRMVGLRRTHRAHTVGDARSGSERAYPRFTRDLRPALGRKRRRGLMADVHDLDPLLTATVVDREQMSAREREQPADSVRLQPARD